MDKDLSQRVSIMVAIFLAKHGTPWSENDLIDECVRICRAVDTRIRETKEAEEKAERKSVYIKVIRPGLDRDDRMRVYFDREYGIDTP